MFEDALSVVNSGDLVKILSSLLTLALLTIGFMFRFYTKKLDDSRIALEECNKAKNTIQEKRVEDVKGFYELWAGMASEVKNTISMMFEYIKNKQ